MEGFRARAFRVQGFKGGRVLAWKGFGVEMLSGGRVFGVEPS